jgi:hypothetical protein
LPGEPDELVERLDFGWQNANSGSLLLRVIDGGKSMKILVTLIALGALGSGLMSARYWIGSAVEPPPPTARIATVIDDEMGRTPLDNWIERVANLNRAAAGWSACAVVLGAVATVLGVWGLA